MADIQSRLPSQDQADGAVGSAAPSEGIQIAGVDSSGTLRAVSVTSTGQLQVASQSSLSNFHYDDMNASTGGIARNTSFVVGTPTTLYSYSGSGQVYGFLLNLGGLPGSYSIDFIVDGNHIFGTSGILTLDLNSNAEYDIGSIANDVNGFLGWAFVDKSLRWSVPGGGTVKYTSSVVLKVTQNSGAAQKFNAGLIALTR